ncbi:MAG: OmpA family protein [Lentisphaeria bacterium]|jgi:flagellar motor protein MotB
MRWNPSLLLGGALAVSLLAGCRSDKIPLTPAQQGAIGGGAVGAGTGAIWAHNAGILDSGEGAAVGLAAGGLVGALVGDALDEYNTKPAIDALNNQVGDLNRQLAGKDVELDGLRRQVEDLNRQLAAQPVAPGAEPLAGGLENVQVEAKDGQIRFTILSEVLFDSGKANLKKDGASTLDAVLAMVEKDFPGREIAIEGHTDSDPIKVSGWKSNWDLSFARSMAVLSHFANQKGVAPDRLKAVACGEFHPVVANDSATNKRRNRRAVIVVMPPQDMITFDKQQS